jgi:DNA processing protein
MGEYDFAYVYTDIPEGMTIRAWRAQRTTDRATARDTQRAARRARSCEAAPTDRRTGSRDRHRDRNRHGLDARAPPRGGLASSHVTVDSQHAALVALLRHTTPRRATELLELHGTPHQALEHALGGGQLTLGPAPDADAAHAVQDAMADVRAWEAAGINVIAAGDPTYPANLATVHDRPLMLTIRGRLAPSDERAVAVVGSRRATSVGLRQASTIATDLVTGGFVVVSGLAAGIDTAAHRATLDAGGRTIAVIGTGLQHAFPRENAELQERLGRQHAVISQFRPDAGPSKDTFRMRTALMASISLVTVVVEAAFNSGARLQARVALENQRPVVLLRSLVAEEEWAHEFAQRPGVYVADAEEVSDRVADLCGPDARAAIRDVGHRIVDEHPGALEILANPDPEPDHTAT